MGQLYGQLCLPELPELPPGMYLNYPNYPQVPQPKYSHILSIHTPFCTLLNHPQDKVPASQYYPTAQVSTAQFGVMLKLRFRRIQHLLMWRK